LLQKYHCYELPAALIRVGGRRLQVTDGWVLDAGCWMLDAGCWMLDAGCWMLDARCGMLDGGLGKL